MGLPKGFKMTEATKHSMSIAHTGMKLSEETKQKLRGQRLGWKMTEESKRKMRESWCYEKHFTPEIKHKLSESHKGKMRSPEHRLRLSEALKGKPKSPQHRQRMSEVRIGRPGHPHADEWKQMMSTVQTGRVFSPETLAKMAKAKEGIYDGEKNPFFGKHHTLETIAQMLQNRQYLRPNKAELKLLAILEPFSFEYVGNGQLIIGGKSPDFWNGDHKLIELYGDYWHRGEDSQKRVDYFANYGYGCLVIWEDELKDREKVLSKITRFSRR